MSDSSSTTSAGRPPFERLYDKSGRPMNSFIEECVGYCNRCYYPVCHGQTRCGLCKLEVHLPSLLTRDEIDPPDGGPAQIPERCDGCGVCATFLPVRPRDAPEIPGMDPCGQCGHLMCWKVRGEKARMRG